MLYRFQITFDFLQKPILKGVTVVYRPLKKGAKRGETWHPLQNASYANEGRMGERCENASISIFLASQMSQEVALLNGRGPKYGSQLCQKQFGVSNLRFLFRNGALLFFYLAGLSFILIIR